MSTSRNTPSRAAAVFAAAGLLFLSQPPAHAISYPPLLTSQSAVSPSPATQLPALLAKAAEYCRKLERSAFDFVCREEIAETINPSLDAGSKSAPSQSGGTAFAGPTISFGWTKKIKRTLIYDLLCGRAGGAIHETRTLLEENGKKKVGPDPQAETPIVIYGTAFLGPVGLFGERFQPNYDFRVAGEEKIGGTRVLVVEAKPKPGAPTGSDLYGKAWIDPAKGDILRLERSESRVGRSDVFEERGRLYKRTPRLVILSEHGVEKNGVRFPSRLSVEEAYLNHAGKAAVRSRTEVVYKDFTSFTVEVDVRD